MCICLFANFDFKILFIIKFLVCRIEKCTDFVCILRYNCYTVLFQKKLQFLKYTNCAIKYCILLFNF